MTKILPPYHEPMSTILDCYLANDRVAELEAKLAAEKQRADEFEKRCADLEILAEKWCEHECLASTCDDCPLEGKRV